ncbi:MAG: OmpA family protein [Candidatus Zambryskibacteria bacterium]|nr:OmpA family protein [Candidatus Zambryskibacteria bacterium]
MKNKFVFVFIFLLTAGMVFAEEGEKTVSSDANSESNAAAIFNDNSIVNSSPQLLNAIPGVSGSILPGYPYQDESFQLFYTQIPNLLRMNYEQVKIMERGEDGKLRGVLYEKTNCRRKDLSFIQLVNYPIVTHHEEGDKIVASVEVEGKSGWPREKFLAVAYKWAFDKGVCTNRASVLTKDMGENVTRGRSFGLGGTGSAAISGGTGGLGAATGGLLGTNRVRREDVPVWKVYFLNVSDTFFHTIKPEPKTVIVTKESEPKSEPQKIEVEVKIPEIKIIQQAPSVPQSSIATPMEKRADDCSYLPDLTVLFDFDKDVITNEYKPKIKEYAEWLIGKSCSIQVEGNTDKVGTYAYNADLGRRRSKAVYDLLTSYRPELKDKIVMQFVSLGEDKPVSEYDQENRRVILRIIGIASDE